MNKEGLHDLSLILGAMGAALVIINALDYLTGTGKVTPMIGYFGLGAVAIALLLGQLNKTKAKKR